MKNISKAILLTILALSSLSVLAAVSGPHGLALDSKGNLYVANSGTNQILVFSPSHVQLTGKTISKAVHSPFGVTVDPGGYVWVANFSNSTVTVYSPGKVLISTITNGINGPYALAADGAGMAWVANGDGSVTVTDSGGEAMRSSPSTYLLGNTSTTIYSIAVFNGLVLFGNNGGLGGVSEPGYLVNNLPAGIGYPNYFGAAVAYDSAGTIWEAEPNGNVNNLYNKGHILTLTYRPAGMAVDSARQLLYFSDNVNNKIDVYTMQGTFVTSMQ